jgi:hypothetical protein
MISIEQKIAGARISVKPAECNNLEGHPWLSIGDRSHSASQMPQSALSFINSYLCVCAREIF